MPVDATNTEKRYWFSRHEMTAQYYGQFATLKLRIGCGSLDEFEEVRWR